MIAASCGNVGAALAAFDAAINLATDKQARTGDLTRVAPALSRLLDEATDSTGKSDHLASASDIEALCRSLIAVGQACTVSAPTAAAAAARAMVSHASSSSAVEQICWLAGDLAADPKGMAAFLAEGGARSLVKLLSTQLDSLGDLSVASVASDTAARAAVAQALVAMCSIAGDAGGAVSLVVSGKVACVRANPGACINSHLPPFSVDRCNIDNYRCHDSIIR